VKRPLLSRRRFIATALLAAPCAVLGEANFVEPTWLKVRHLRIGTEPPVARFVHFTDLHHKGDRDYLQAVVNQINALAPDFVCFTGDLIENGKYLPEALEFLAQIKAPLYGVPGNHDYWSKMPFAPIAKCFADTGGAWLMNASRDLAGGKINLIGITCLYQAQPVPPSRPQAKNILLMHYPAWAKKLGGQKFDLMLAGHSHGGQVRIPFYGALITPFGVDGYDLGFYQTPAGPLYVNPGIGWYYVNARFNCRPEITVIEI
jgi:hypothetical protein